MGENDDRRDNSLELIHAVRSHRKDLILDLQSRGVDINFLPYGEDENTALVEALYCNFEDMIEFLLNQGAEINLVGGPYGTALATAAILERKDSVNLLLDRGAEINLVGGPYGTALVAAACSNDEEILHLLLDRGAEINLVGGDYGTALSAVALRQRKDLVNLLLDQGAEINLVGGHYGAALAAAACTNNEEILHLLLDRGAEINLVSGHYGTALAAAAHSGRKEIVNLLLDQGAETNLVGGHYGTALAAAAYRDRKDIVNLLLDQGAKINLMGGHCGTALAAAAYSGGKEVVNILLDQGAEINLVGGHYGSALAAAAYMDNKEILHLLLDHGAEINLVGGHYGTALAAAAYMDNEEILHLLLDQGAEINLVGGHYGTALATAAYGEWKEGTLSLLLDRGADINLIGGIYGTALATAAHGGNDTKVSLLLNRGAEVNLIGGIYGTALATAAHGGRYTTVNLLLDRGADINKYASWAQYGSTAVATVISCRYFQTPEINADYDRWEPAKQKNFDITIRVLLDQGADVNLGVDEYGTLLGKAAYEGNMELILLLLNYGADIFHVGGCKYHTENFGYPTALDAAKAGDAPQKLCKLLYDTMEKHRCEMHRDSTIWPPFPMPAIHSEPSLNIHKEDGVEAVRSVQSIFSYTQDANRATRLTLEQAEIPCQVLDRAQVLVDVLKTLVEIHPGTAHLHERLIQNDTQYFISQGYDLGLAYAVCRIAWKDFNDPEATSKSILQYRHTWLRQASQYKKERGGAICVVEKDSNQVIKSPYLVMPRRLWDIYSNRVVDYGMLHSDFCVRKKEVVPEVGFWAVTHSWTNSMTPVKTAINAYEWPVPLPSGLDLEKNLRRELLDLGAEYVWLDVLCLRQETTVQYQPDYIARNRIKEEEWKLDVPTIGNIYRSAAAVVRYFNGLGIPFSNTGLDDPRHWLQRAWTLQEIKNENITFNGGFDTQLLNLRTREFKLTDTLRPILRLAAEVDSPNGCSVYALAREMARRYATQPTDKVSGLMYLLRAINLPTYNERVTDENAWTQCLPVLPFGRKMELLFDFPYRSGRYPTPREVIESPLPPTGHDIRDCNQPADVADHTDLEHTEQRWFPTWVQLMNWPIRNPDYDHTLPASPYAQSKDLPELPPALTAKYHNTSLFITSIWGVSRVSLRTSTNDDSDYVVEVGGRLISFYRPYLGQSPLRIQKSQNYTLATPHPQVSSNWVVCELVDVCEWEQNQSKTETAGAVEYEVLRKVGVLRTDFCSILYVGAETGRNTLLKKMNALFI